MKTSENLYLLPLKVENNKQINTYKPNLSYSCALFITFMYKLN